MRLSGRPLLDIAVDAALFLDPDTVLPRLGRAVREDLNVLLVGARGAGKSSIIRQLALAARTSAVGLDVVLLDAGSVGSVGGLLRAVTGAIAPAPRARIGPVDGESSVLDLLDLLKLCRTQAEAREERFVVVVDNLVPDLAHPMFGQLRDDLWSLPFGWVVTCADADEAAFRRPPADAFFDTVVRIEAIAPDVLRELVRRRASIEELPDPALDLVVELARGNPREALDAARVLALDPEAGDGMVKGRARRAEVLGRLGRPAAMLLDELVASGGASASDAGLLRRLGWTRSRATQVLHQLERDGLAEATDVRDGPGRPRRVYRPTGRLSG